MYTIHDDRRKDTEKRRTSSFYFSQHPACNLNDFDGGEAKKRQKKQS